MRSRPLSMRSAEGAPELAAGLRDKRAMMEGWKRGLTELLSGAPLRDGLPAEAAALAIMMSVNGTAATWLACPELFSPADQAEALADAVLYGLADRTLAGAELTGPGTRSGEPRGSGSPTSG
ncbi:hypothetical protein [Nonomuraea rubra]|uniref:hypothetical protein n=1 Tax=Nonomuraea rubra TaxID=46180 RepID=UPI0033EC4DD8